MRFPEGSPEVSFVVAETPYVMWAPYTPEMFNMPEGLGSPEIMARKANQTLKDDISNNWRNRVKKSNEVPTQEDFETYLTEYEPGIRKTAAAADPVEAKALTLAKAELRKVLRSKKNLKVAKKGAEPEAGFVPFEVFEAKALELLGRHADKYRAKAQEILDANSTSVADDIDI